MLHELPKHSLHTEIQNYHVSVYNITSYWYLLVTHDSPEGGTVLKSYQSKIKCLEVYNNFINLLMEDVK